MIPDPESFNEFCYSTEYEDRSQDECDYSISFPYYVTIEKVSPYLE